MPDVDDPSNHIFEFYALRRNWSEANATWNNADTGVPWSTSARALARQRRPPNYGFAIQDYADATSDGFRFNSFNSANPPRLIVQYCPQAVALRVMYLPLVVAPGEQRPPSFTR